MTTLSFITAEAAASFVAKSQDVSFVTGVVYEQFGSFNVDVIFDGLTTPSQLDDAIFPEGMVRKKFGDDGNLINWN